MPRLRVLAATSLLPLAIGLTGAAAPPNAGWLNPLKPACFARTYDQAHMTAHPKQQVVSLAVRYLPKDGAGNETPSDQWEMMEDRAIIHVTLAATLRNQSVPLLASAQCGALPGQTLDCTVDVDGRTFQLQQSDKGALLKNPEGISVSPATGDMAADAKKRVSIETKDDHESFALPAATGGLCDVKWPAMK